MNAAAVLFGMERVTGCPLKYVKVVLKSLLLVDVVSSADLVPGDLVQLHISTMGNIAPCDLVLLSGDCIMNEAMLTGESIPVSKVVLPQRKIDLLRQELLDQDSVSLKQVSKSILYSGTRFVRVRGEEKEAGDMESFATAMVLRTGEFFTLTCKGSQV
jgi:cation-transporting ATPase 13A3/4/5